VSIGKGVPAPVELEPAPDGKRIRSTLYTRRIQTVGPCAAGPCRSGVQRQGWCAASLWDPQVL